MPNRKPSSAPIILCDNPPQIDPLILEMVDPEAIMESSTVIGFDEINYTHLILNLHRIKAHLIQKKAVVHYYQSCISEYKQMNQFTL